MSLEYNTNCYDHRSVLIYDTPYAESVNMENGLKLVHTTDPEQN